MKTKMVSRLHVHKVGMIVPNGVYEGRMSGYEVSFIFASDLYWFQTENGIRGIDVPCIITVHNGEIYVETK